MKFEVEIVDMGRARAFHVPFDPKEAFGKVRAPVRATINEPKACSNDFGETASAIAWSAPPRV